VHWPKDVPSAVCRTVLQLSKLLCASTGQGQFTMEAWDGAVQLERQRRARVAAMQAH
jgi:hypothetical protein